MNVMLIDPPSPNYISSFAPAFSLGILSIQSILEKNGHEVESVNFHGFSWIDIENKIKNYKPTIVGISCLTENRGFCYEFSKRLKIIAPETIIIFGNIHATFFANQILLKYPVDIIVHGEGEFTMLKLIQALTERGDLKEINGISYKHEGRVCQNPPRSFIKDLDSLPFSKKHRIYYLNNKKYANVLTSRGCPFNCKFCSSADYWQRKIRYRNIDTIIKELSYLDSIGVEFVDFVDDLFTLNERRVLELCSAISENEYSFKWIARARVDCISDKMVKAMKEGGCVKIYFGVESGSPIILKSLNKQTNIERAYKAFEYSKKYNVESIANFIIGSPGETKETIQDTIKFIKKTNPDNLALSIARIFPNTIFGNLAQERNLISKEFWLEGGGAPFYTLEWSDKQLRYFTLKILFLWIKRKKISYILYYIADQLKMIGIKRMGIFLTSYATSFWNRVKRRSN